VPYALGGALAVAVAALIITNIGGSDEPERAVITMTGANEASGVLHELEDGIVVMEVAGLEPLEADQTYQVWAIRGSDAESLGLLGTAPEGEAIGAMRVDLADVDAIAVSTEPADGSVSPTTDPVLQTEDLSS
jgi:anti-sigma-K factor RskA